MNIVKREFVFLKIFFEEFICDIFMGIDWYISLKLRMNIKNSILWLRGLGWYVIFCVL